jgi:aminoglycoside 6-adenylyltransferase
MQAWVDGGVWESLYRTFPHFDSQDSWKALIATTTLFRQLAIETADALGFAYPHEVDSHISQFIQYTSRLEPNKGEAER